MTVGIIAEGRGDHATLSNILKGACNINRSEIQYMLPEYQYDQTDLHTMQVSEFGSWTRVRQECLTKELIQPFFELFGDDHRFIVIQIDTAERKLTNFEVYKPDLMADEIEYCMLLRNNVVNKINDWLGHNYTDNIRYAIAVEETEAWILPLFGLTDTSHFHNPKEKLHREINNKFSSKTKKQHFRKSIFDQYDFLSKPLGKPKELDKAKKGNESLNLFCISLETLNMPK
jgi:hypothetical protein